MNIEKIMQDKNIKITPARTKILEILLKEKKPISYEDIKENISMDKATFYRNISLFEKEGILTSFESNDKKRYFELKQTPHAHFVCIVCNKMECIHQLDINLEGYEVSNVIVNGICKECKKSKIF